MRYTTLQRANLRQIALTRTKVSSVPTAFVKAAVQSSQVKFWKPSPALITVLLMLMSAPALAEAPLDESVVPQIKPSQVAAEQDDLLQRNQRRLLLLNECRRCDLSGVVLTGRHLIGADLREANLQDADLTGSNFEGADLSEADLMNANFSYTFLTDVRLVDAQLDNVNFTGAHLYSVNVEGASMRNLTLTDARLFDTPIYVGGEEDLVK